MILVNLYIKVSRIAFVFDVKLKKIIKVTSAYQHFTQNKGWWLDFILHNPANIKRPFLTSLDCNAKSCLYWIA